MSPTWTCLRYCALKTMRETSLVVFRYDDMFDCNVMNLQICATNEPCSVKR